MKSDLVQTGTYVLSAIALAGTKYSKQVLKKLFMKKLNWHYGFQ
jgi:hypothetical protein